jgi:hypothetical protein
MEKVIVRYKLKPGRVEENEQLVKEVYKQLSLEEPEGFSYATYKLEDGLTFIHVALHEPGSNPLPGLTAFKNFQADIKDRCDELPVVNHVTEIGSYTMERKKSEGGKQ